MSLANEPLTEFERNARTVLEQSVGRIDARTRSRLTRARHAALEALETRRPAWWRRSSLMPTASAAAAALLVAVFLWHRQPAGESALPETHASAVEDMDLLADSDALELMEGWDGPFYEWAVTQPESNAESEG